MTLEQLGTVFQIIGTLGVIASLIFVGAQIRQNTKATRVQVQENMTSDYIAVAQILIDNADAFTGESPRRANRLLPSPPPTNSTRCRDDQLRAEESGGALALERLSKGLRRCR